MASPRFTAELLLATLTLAAACKTPDAGRAPPAAELRVTGGLSEPTTLEEETAHDAARPPVRPSDFEGPKQPRRFAPALTRAAEDVSGLALAQPEACARCHPQVVEEWRTSAHAFSSFNNPIYRASVETLRRDVGFEASRFCAGCHDPLLLVDGAMDVEVDAVDRRAHEGVTCLVCHSAEASHTDGNGSYELEWEGPLRPTSESAVRRHRRAMRPQHLRTATFCGSCHKGFLGPRVGNPNHLVGMDDHTPWLRSAYAGTRTGQLDEKIEPRTCQQCHMPQRNATQGVSEGKRVASHRFLGGHTWLAAMRGDPDTRRAVAAQLSSAVTLDVARVQIDGQSTLAPVSVEGSPEHELTFDVVLRNTSVGHRFPGGTRDVQATWLETRLVDRHGRVVGESAPGIDGADAHHLLAQPGDEHGTPVRDHRTHRFRAPLFDTTIKPRDAAVVRYAFSMEKALDPARAPLTLVVELKHQSRSEGMQQLACRESRTQAGRAFQSNSARFARPPLDPCAPQPITLLAKRQITIAAAQPQTESEPRRRRRLYDYALGMLKELPEKLDQLRPLFDETLATYAPAEAAPFLFLAAELEISQNRLPAALRLLDDAQRVIGEHPAIWRARGDAFASVWRWEDASGSYERVATLASQSDAAWSDLALSHGSAGRPQPALDAALRGLAIAPRNEQLLRTRALSLEALGHDQAETALAQYLEFRLSDDIPSIRGRCRDRLQECAREQLGVHEHRMIAR